MPQSSALTRSRAATTLDSDGTTAEWWRTAVVYEVYPRSFRDANGDGVGDLEGVRRNLPYLEALGVDAIWFTPWYRSPLADGGYDVEDYRDIDPAFGTLAQAERLIAEARERGIRTIIDVVPNHVSERHPWFQEALAAEPGSEARRRFWFHPGAGAGGNEVPTHWKNNFAGDVWTRTTGADGEPGEWYLHLFASEQPDLNWNHPDVVREHENILRFWFDRGVAGIRIDSAAHIMTRPCPKTLATTRRARTRTSTATRCTTSTAAGGWWPTPTTSRACSSARCGCPTSSGSLATSTVRCTRRSTST
jgi:alpha-glucosidase